MTLMKTNLGERREEKREEENNGKEDKMRKGETGQEERGEMDQKKEKDSECVLDIARGSVQHWRTSPWSSSTVATPDLFSFPRRLSLSH